MSLALLTTIGGCLIGEHPFWDPESGNDSTSDTVPTGDTSTPTDSAASDDATPGSTTATTQPGSTTEPMTSTGPMPTMGQPCADDVDCDDGERCGFVPEGMDACLILCVEDPTVCPAGTVCAHGFCLLECSSDEDCAPWPGFTCQHNNTACENDEYDPKAPE